MSPGEPRSRLGPQGPTPKGLGLDGGEVRRHCVAAMGNRNRGGPWGDRGRGQRVVSRRVVKAEMRGLVTAGPGVRLERSAGLRTSVARGTSGGHGLLIASGRVAPRAVGLDDSIPPRSARG